MMQSCVPMCGHESKTLAQEKWTGFIQPRDKGKKKLVASSPWRKEKWAGCIQPMELKTIEKKKNGLVLRKEERDEEV